MIVRTANSTYEIDAEGKRVRRLHGKYAATERQSADGEWKSFVIMSDPQVGQSVLFGWSQDEETGTLKSTYTSPIVSIDQVPEN